MANTKTLQVITGGTTPGHWIATYNLVSDGTQETATTIYTNASYINDVTKGKLMRLHIAGYSPTGLIKIFWKATTNQPVISASLLRPTQFDFYPFGGIPNIHGSGATGDLIFTTLGLATGDAFTLVLDIWQN